MKNRFQVKRNSFGLALVDTQVKMTIINEDGSKFDQDFVIMYSEDQNFLQKRADFCNLHGRNVAAAYQEKAA